MAHSIEVLEYTLPDYLACYLINGDIDGIGESEKNKIDSFLASQNIRIVGKLNDSSFCHWNDLYNIGANCSTYIAYKITH